MRCSFFSTLLFSFCTQDLRSGILPDLVDLQLQTYHIFWKTERVAARRNKKASTPAPATNPTHSTSGFISSHLSHGGINLVMLVWLLAKIAINIEQPRLIFVQICLMFDKFRLGTKN